MNKTLKSILLTSMISVLTTISILYLYKEFTGIKVPSKIDEQVNTKDSITIKTPDININLVLLLERKKCIEELLVNEREGKVITNNCGSTSGKPGIGMRYKEMKSQIEKIKNEIDSISNIILLEENKKKEKPAPNTQ